MDDDHGGADILSFNIRSDKLADVLRGAAEDVEEAPVAPPTPRKAN